MSTQKSHFIWTEQLKGQRQTLTQGETLQLAEDCGLMRCFYLSESRLGHLCHHYHPREGERCGLQQAIHGLLSGDLNKEAWGENQHFLSFRSIWFCGLGLHCSSHPCGWCADICVEPDTGCEDSECSPAPAICVCHFTQCHLDRLWGLRTARYLSCFPVE